MREQFSNLRATDGYLAERQEPRRQRCKAVARLAQAADLRLLHLVAQRVAGHVLIEGQGGQVGVKLAQERLIVDSALAYGCLLYTSRCV